MYIVIKKFKDLEDEYLHIYECNDVYPYDNREISTDRIEKLSTINNKIGVPLIKYKTEKSQENSFLVNNPVIDEEKKLLENTIELNSEEITLDLNDLKQPKLKEIAEKLGIKFKSIISNDELKELIQEKRAEINSNRV